MTTTHTPNDDTSNQSHLRKALHDTGDTLKDKAFEAAERRKSDAAASLDAFANSIRSAADELADNDQSTAARLVDGAARGLEGFSRSLNERSLADMSRNLSDFGHRHPMALAAGGLLLGLAVGRLVRASGEETSYEAWDDDDDDFTDEIADSDIEDFNEDGAYRSPEPAFQSPVSPSPTGPVFSDTVTPETQVRSTSVLGDDDGTR
jgi:hypothetical protein